MTFCAPVAAAFAITAEPAAAAVRLEQTESLRTIDHPQFLRQLKELHQLAAGMSTHDRWHLRYLDGWQASYQGDYASADPMLQDVIDHSGDPALVTKATAILMDDMGSTKRYAQAFELANRLVIDLPKIQDKLARFLALEYVSQLLRSAGQYDLAAEYAREMDQARPPGVTSCQSITALLIALYDSRQLTSTSAELQRGLAACQAGGEPVFIDTIWLVKGDVYLDENQPREALALLDRLAPSIHASQYHYQMQTYQSELAQAYWKLGDGSTAHKAALAAIALSDPSDISESLRDAYEVLYHIEKKHGNAVAALAYYEHYVAQDKGYLNDISARALAYQMAQQHVLVQKLETERLSKQNNILRLQQALGIKAVETGRLYIALLLVVLVSIVFWLFRLKRSQLRFKKLSWLDGLTGIFNHQHFISEAERTLRLLEKKRGMACLISIDLDHFKQVNDTHGHAMGDAVLRHTVAICQEQLRPTDLFGRLGGEEFGILLPECSRHQGMVIADRIRLAIETTEMNKDGCTVSFSVSVGVACTDMSGYELQRLCKDADAALYRAKRAGRNRVIADTENDNLVEG
jgi:diguanylate cyclase (GGDEF)-like protein